MDVHHRRLRRTVAAATVLIGVAGCAGEGGDTTAPTTSPTTTFETSGNETTMGEIEPGLQPLVDAAVADLAGRLGVPGDDIVVVSAEAVVWGDTSLGCPQPDMRYKQVPQDGSKIVLSHDATTFPYHAGGTRTTPFLCEQRPHKGSPSPKISDPSI